MFKFDGLRFRFLIGLNTPYEGPAEGGRSINYRFYRRTDDACLADLQLFFFRLSSFIVDSNSFDVATSAGSFYYFVFYYNVFLFVYLSPLSNILTLSLSLLPVNIVGTNSFLYPPLNDFGSLADKPFLMFLVANCLEVKFR